MGCLEPRKGPPGHPRPHDTSSLSNLELNSCPSSSSPGRTCSQGPRSLVGHSNLPAIPCPSHSPLLLWPSYSPPTVPHPHFWPELDRGNSSWQTPKAGMREIHKPDVLLQREGSGGWEQVKGRGRLSPCPTAASPWPPRQRGWWVHISPGPGQHKDYREISEGTSFPSALVEKAPGISCEKAEACL